MGTRHLIVVIADGANRIAQYGQWDGYPEGQGATALEFLRKADLAAFKSKCLQNRFGTDVELKAIAKPHGDNWKEKHPELSRDAGADILKMVYDSKAGLMLSDQHDFAADSLMCEFAYVVDLDKRTFEVFRGFNKTPIAPTERFFPLESKSDGGYHPVRLLKSYSLDSLPTKTKFLKDLTPEGEE